jgi:hypothetical protein
MNPPATRLRRSNGKRSLTFVPANILAWPGGYTPITETESLVALGWIMRELARWKSDANVFDLMRTGSGRGHDGFPELVIEENNVFKHLHHLLTRLVNPKQNAEFVRFAREVLGFKSIDTPLQLPVRTPPSDVFAWLRSLYGCRLKVSPNRYHRRAVWLHGAALRLNAAGTCWCLRVSYSYRHDESSWVIGLDQRPGESLEAFDARAWVWVRDQIRWRNPEAFYNGFMIPADAMKQNELRSCAEVERRMFRFQKELRDVFSWGKGAPGFWENDIAESLVRDVCPQFRELAKIEMTGPRLAAMRRWIRQDRRAARAREKETA